MTENQDNDVNNFQAGEIDTEAFFKVVRDLPEPDGSWIEVYKLNVQIHNAALRLVDPGVVGGGVSKGTKSNVLRALLLAALAITAAVTATIVVKKVKSGDRTEAGGDE
jgi:hypothetical protein